MQDNNKDIFADKGWEAMELILDKELPQNKKRRFFIWWLFGGVLVLATFLILWFGNGKGPGIATIITDTEKVSSTINDGSRDKELGISPNTVEGPENTTHKIKLENSEVAKKIKRSAVVDKINPLAVEQNSQERIKQKEQRNNTKSRSSISGIPAEKSEFSPDSKATVEVVLDRQDIMLTTKKLEKEEIGLADIITGAEDRAITKSDGQVDSMVPKTKVPRKDQNLIDESIARIIEEPLRDRLMLNLAKLTPISIFDEIHFERIVDIVVHKEEKQSYWYANIGGYLNYSPTVKLYGMDTELDFGHSFNSTISLGVTFGLGSFRYATSTNQQTAITTTGRTLFSNDEASNVLNSSFSNTTYLDLGIHGAWHLGAKLSLRVDAGYSYLFTAMFDRNTNSLDASFDTQDPAGIPLSEATDIEVEGEKGEVFDFDYQLDRKWFPYTGVSLQAGINDRVGVELGYRKFYGDLFASSSNPLSMNRIRLGVNYRFLQKASKP